MKQETAAKIHELIEETIRDGVTAGVLVRMTEDGEETFYAEHGYADIEAGKKLKRDAIFRMFSMSKPITAVAAMVLMEQGKLDLGQPVRELIPGFGRDYVMENGRKVHTRHQMTVLDLLNMTSGLAYGDGPTAADLMTTKLLMDETEKLHRDDAIGTVELAVKLGNLPRAFEPGTNWRYGLSADVLGAVIECVTGERYGDWLKKNVLEPLGMKDTDFYVPSEKQDRLATTYRELPGTMKKKGELMRPYKPDPLLINMKMDRRPNFESGGAGICSTLDDYGRLMQMLMNGGTLDGVRLLSPGTIAFLTSGNLTPEQQKESDYRLDAMSGFTYQHLLRQMRDPGRYAGLARMDEYGWDSFTGCYFANFPHENKTMLLMEQKAECGTIPLVRKIRNVWLSEWE